MQRGARFLTLGVPLEVQHGPSEGVKNIYKTNAFVLIYKMKGTPWAQHGPSQGVRNVIKLLICHLL